VLWNPSVSREQRLQKVALSFQLLTHYFNLSCLPHDAGISQRFCSKTTLAVTVVEDAGWLRILNPTLILINAIISGDENWSCSRLGTQSKFLGSAWNAEVGHKQTSILRPNITNGLLTPVTQTAQTI
jgi:hypothetical protein